MPLQQDLRTDKAADLPGEQARETDNEQGAREFAGPRLANSSWPGSSISSRKPPIPPVQNHRKRRCQCQYNRQSKRWIARDNRREQRATCRPRHLREAEQGCRDSGFMAERRQGRRARQRTCDPNSEQEDGCGKEKRQERVLRDQHGDKKRDGSNNRGRPVNLARDEAVAAGMGINGLPILALEPDLDRYYYDNVIGGPGAFVVAAQSYATFADAILKKLITEIAANER